MVDHVIGPDPLPEWLQSLSPPLSANPQVRALAILIVDEPTAALDAVTEAQVFEAIRRSGRDALRS